MSLIYYNNVPLALTAFIILPTFLTNELPFGSNNVQISTLHAYLNNPKQNHIKYPEITENFLRNFEAEAKSSFNLLPKIIRGNYPAIISNLHEYLEPFTRHNCLVTLDNFLGLNLPSSQQVPIILRKFSPGLVISSENPDAPIHDRVNTDFIWLPDNIQTMNVTTHLINCTSKFLPGFPTNVISGDLCLRINKFMFSSLTKPWNCQVQLSMLFPTFLLDQDNMYFRLPNTFEYDVGRDNPELKQIFPSNQPAIHFYLPHPTVNLFDDDAKTDSIWRLLNADNLAQNFFEVSQSIVVAMAIVNKYDTSIQLRSILLMDDQWEIYRMATSCPTCISGNDSPFVSFLSKHHLESYDRLKKAGSFPGPHQMTNWRLTGDYFFKNDKVLESFQLQMDDCYNHISQSKDSLIELRDFTATDRIAHAHAHLWQSIMQNYSYVVNYHSVCSNGEWATENEDEMIMNMQTHHAIQLTGKIYFGHVPQQFHFTIPDKINSLQFVSCGDERWSRPAYKELIGVFDMYVWLFTLLGTGAVAGILQILGDHKKSFMSFLRKTESVLMVLLEQGDAFGSKQKCVDNILIVTFSFAAIVLSNAYKNKNVLNVIAPVQAEPYQHFSELLENNFTIYSRTSQVHLPLPKTRRDVLPVIKGTQKHKVEFIGRYQSAATSEVSNLYMSKILSGNFDFMSAYHSRDYNVSEHTSLHPSIGQLLIGLLMQYQILLPVNPKRGRGPTKREIARAMVILEKMFYRKEESFLYGHLKQCEKVALVLPGYMCNEYMKRIVDEHSWKQDQIYVGKEEYFKGYNVFSVGGYVGPSLIWRMKSMEESGLIEWWTKFIRSSSSAFAEGAGNLGILRKPNMGGNIMVIFVVMFVGQLASLVLFLLENRIRVKTVWRCISKVCKYRRKTKVKKMEGVIMVKSEKVFNQRWGYLP